MCGRYTLKSSPEVLAQQFRLEDLPLFEPRYNIAPAQPVPVIRLTPADGRRRLELLRWGLIPSWAKDPRIGAQMINAKAETVAEKPAFRAAFRRRRCLMPADGFYEWQRQGRHKQPMYICLRDHTPFAFAGLWEQWEVQEKTLMIESCALLTTEPNDLLQPIHARMPVILDPEYYDQWLDPDFQQVDRLKPLLRPYPSEKMVAYPVSLRVNNPQYDDAQCLEPVAAQRIGP